MEKQRWNLGSYRRQAFQKELMRRDMAKSENRFAELDQLQDCFDVAEKQEQTP